uniref:Uncharacterized protein n=1 Tax=Myoviridae sp. ctGRa7 TaxID=2826633 RepID=A0A8S5MZG7_9CAUD|nr:MAG TPA: hypothetical protein [Myoviridae sp. ctGRa7]
MQKKHRTTRAASNIRKAWGPCKSGTPTPLWLSNYRARYEKTPSTVLKLRDGNSQVA